VWKIIRRKPLEDVVVTDPETVLTIGIEKILTMNNLKKRHALLLSGVACARRIGSQWIIFYFIVRLSTLLEYHLQ